MSLEITERWVIDRVKLDHDNLDDVKSLALPGTYHEKISSLGFALQNFTRLQLLDLSKNNLTSLKGLEHLTLLEQLNLYYNKIQDLKEIFRLRKNQNLRDVDLRLNPVTGSEPDYRLFIAHMLPLLRRLDDRPVRDSERKAALMHFSSGEKPSLLSGDEEEKFEQKSSTATKQPRVAFIKNTMQKPSVLQDDAHFDDVIDYVDKRKTKPNPSAARTSKSATQLHTKEDLVRIVRKQAKEEERKAKEKRFSGIELEDENLKFQDENLKFQDEDSAYTQYQSFANFTPHPGSKELPPTVNQQPLIVNQQHSHAPALSQGVPPQKSSAMSSDDEYRELPERTKLNFTNATTAQEVNRRKNLTQIKFVESMLDLVDRYWNGSKSLHYHQKFQSLIYKPLEKYEKDLSAAREVQVKVLHDKLSMQQNELEELRKKLKHLSKSDDKSEELAHAQRDLDATKQRLQLTVSDNKILRNKITELEKQASKRGNEDEGERRSSGKRMEELEEQKKELIQQVTTLKRAAEQYEKISQLATMLQESHRSLVSTNEHLLSELEETRCRHQSEIEQLKWSYDQLRSASKLTNGHLSNDEV